MTGPQVHWPAEAGVRADADIPPGTLIDLDPGTRQLAPGVLFGGSPARLLRLTAAGARALGELRAGTVSSAAGAALARQLTAAGLAHPRPGPLPAALDVTVVIPVRDRVAELDRCLTAAGSRYPVLVVDDGSADPAALAAVCAARGARLVRRPVNGGPAAARNTALRRTGPDRAGSRLIAFLDSDCIPPPDWINALAGHFADPLVAAVAPRIVGAGPGRGSALDLGDRRGRVAPLTRIAYVPAAALLVRRAAISSGFDESLRYGEDVDLIWRLVEAGWQVRYEPSVQVPHCEPPSRPARLRRRFHYGTSAAPLTRRHPGSVAPLVLQPWPAVTMAALLGRRPLVAAAAFAASAALLARRLNAADLPARGLLRPLAGGVWQTWLGTGRWCGQYAWPAVLLVLAYPGGRTRQDRRGRRLAAASLLTGPPLALWARDRDVSPVLAVADALADAAAYGAGVYAGCLRERLISPVLPAVAGKSLHRRPHRRPQRDPSPARPRDRTVRPDHRVLASDARCGR